MCCKGIEKCGSVVKNALKQSLCNVDIARMNRATGSFGKWNSKRRKKINRRKGERKKQKVGGRMNGMRT